MYPAEEYFSEFRSHKVLFGLGQASSGMFALGQLAIGFYFGLGQIATGMTAIAQIGIE